MCSSDLDAHLGQAGGQQRVDLADPQAFDERGDPEDGDEDAPVLGGCVAGHAREGSESGGRRGHLPWRSAGAIGGQRCAVVRAERSVAPRNTPGEARVISPWAQAHCGEQIRDLT